MKPLLLAMILFYSVPADAIQLDQQGCLRMAVWGGDIVWARDVGADKQKVREYLVKNSQEVPYFRILVRIFDLLWKTEEERESVIRGLYNDCAQRRGNYGSEV